MPSLKRQDLSQIPSGQPPDGVIPNFVDPISIGYVPRIGIYVLLPIMLTAMVLRIGTRAKITHTLGLDDVLCIVAAVFSVSFAAVTLPFLGNPLGRHQWDVPVSEVTDGFVKSSLEAQVFQNLAIMFIKISLMVFYLRIFKPVRWAQIAIWTGLVGVSIFYAITIIVQLVLCVPRNGETWLQVSAQPIWTERAKNISLATGWFGMFADIYIIGIPISLVSTLMLSKGRKIGIMAIFLTGLIACGCSAAGLAQRYKLTSTDQTYNDVLVYMYGTAEVNIAILCSCMPAFTAPLRTLTTRMASSWNYLKRSSETLLPRKETSVEGQEGLPAVPRANISGLRTFIRRFNRSTSEQTAVEVDMSNFSKLGSVDEDYHQQLRALHATELRVPSRPNTSGRPSRGGE